MRWLPWGAGAVLVALFAGGGSWWAFRSDKLQSPPNSASSDSAPQAPSGPASDATLEKPGHVGVPQAAVDPVAVPPLADEAQILADRPTKLAVYRFFQRPAIVVLQFPTLQEQALTLNRVAALTEKSDFSHTTVPSRDQLDAKIIAAGGRPDTFYYGHDYSAASLVRFFALATDLNPQEKLLQQMLRGFGWEDKDAVGALISLVRQSSAPDLDEPARVAILRHELSHGFYFTDPVYAEYCRRFWRDVLTADERAKFSDFLSREGYDTALTDLIINETQAYLMHTPDKRFFSASAVGIQPTRVAELRQIFIVGMPPGWLRDSTMADKL